GDRSRNAPTVVNVGDWVWPISTTSGVFAASGSAVVSAVTRSPHSCCSITRVEPGFCSAKVVLRYSRSSSGVSPPASQSVISAPSGAGASVSDCVGLAASVPEGSGVDGDDEQAARASVAATPTAANRRIFTLGFLPGIRLARCESVLVAGGGDSLRQLDGQLGVVT